MIKKIFLLLVVLTVLVTGCSKNDELDPENEVPVPPVQEGRDEEDEDIVVAPSMDHKDLFSITIDNNPGAWPQTGLNSAQRIYEVPVEGGITRFIAFYMHDEVKRIGPVRSARVDFVDIIAPYNSSFAHCGGARPAIEKIKREVAKDLDEINNASFAFFRDKSLKAPHNLFTSTALLNSGFERRGFTNKTDFEYQQSIDETFSDSTASKISIPYFRSTSYNYLISYEYDNERDVYLRYTNDKFHALTDAETLMFKGVVLIKVNFSNLSNGGMDFQTIGENDAYIFYKGKYLETKWKKSSTSDLYTFLIHGEYVEINNPGFMYQILPSNRTVTVQ